MCLVAFSIGQHRRFPLVLASNRDEFFARPALPLDWWSAEPGGLPVLGGRDLASGGTWLGLSAPGRLAFVTNVRGAPPGDVDAPSRGRIVTDWLAGTEDSGAFWMRTSLSGYAGFNLVAIDFQREECFWGSNLSAHPRRLEPGLHGVSNGTLNEPWPKVVALKDAVQRSLDAAEGTEDLAARLLEALADRTVAPDGRLPQTGVPLARERQLSPAFIHLPDADYGTRCSTVLIAERGAGRTTTRLFERSFDAAGAPAGLRRATLAHWPPARLPAPSRQPAVAGAVVDGPLPRRGPDPQRKRQTTSAA